MALSAKEAQADLTPLIERVNDDYTAVEITSERGNAVLMSRVQYEAMEETAHLFRSPDNARRLFAADVSLRRADSYD